MPALPLPPPLPKPAPLPILRSRWASNGQVRSVVAGLERRTEIASTQSMRSTVCKIPLHATRQDWQQERRATQTLECLFQPFAERLLICQICSGRNRLSDLYFVTCFWAGLFQITRFWTNRIPAALPVIKSRVND